MTRTASIQFLLAATAAVTTACSSAPGPAGSGTAPAPSVSRSATDSGATQQPSASTGTRRSRNSSVITAAELADPSLSSTDVLTAIERLRPRYLSSRGPVSLGGRGGGVMVSVDRGVLVSLDALRSMRVTDVKEIRYLSPGDAAQQFGTKSASGAVIVVTRR